MGQKRATFSASVEVLKQIFKLPEDTIVTGAEFDAARYVITLHVAGDSYFDSPEAGYAPEYHHVVEKEEC